MIDVGGTTTDIGMLVAGFPRRRSEGAEIGGIPTNFRVPDVYSFGLGGGSLVQSAPLAIGPQSVGFRLTEKALCFGGDTLTATDIAVAAGLVTLGDPARVRHLDAAFVQGRHRKDENRCRSGAGPDETQRRPDPGRSGGRRLGPDWTGSLAGTSVVAAARSLRLGQCHRGRHRAGLGRGGPGCRRWKARRAARHWSTIVNDARARAVEAGARADSVELVELEETPLAYLPGNAIRIARQSGGRSCA